MGTIILCMKIETNVTSHVSEYKEMKKASFSYTKLTVTFICMQFFVGHET